MTESITNALIFLINTLMDLYLFVLTVRVILVYVGANYFNPLVQFVVKATNFLVKPLNRLIPKINRFELATIFLICILDAAKFIVLSLLMGNELSLYGLPFLVLGDTLKFFILTFFYAIILQALMTWVQPHAAMNTILYQLTAPIMRPFQRYIPPIGGVDISPIPALISLQLLLILLVNPLMAAGFSAAVH